MPRCVTCRGRFVKCWPWATRFRPGGFGYRIWIHRACTRVRPEAERRRGWVARRQEQHAAWLQGLYGPGGTEWEESRLERDLARPAHVRERRVTDTTTDDRALLNQLAEQARHWQDVDDLREQQADLRARRNQHDS